MTIKHIFSDMDGTLLQSDCTISEKNVSVIKSSTIPLTLVSARSPKQMLEVIDKLDLREPQIAFNGGLIFQKGTQNIEILNEDHLDISEVSAIVDMVKRDFPKVNCSFFDANDWYIEQADQRTEKEAKFGGQNPTMANFVSLLKQTDLKVYKIMLIVSDLQEMQGLIAEMDKFNPGNLNIKQSSATYLEVTSTSADKSKGVKYIQNLENLDKQDMAAFGDGNNDVAMLKEVGTPIVMENALDGVKEYGKYLTKDNDSDGVAYGISRYLLEK